MRLMQAAVAAALGLAMLGSPADAAVVIDIFQSGGDVEVAGSGAIDLTDLTFNGTGSLIAPGVLGPSAGVAIVGTGGAAFVIYTGFSGPASFGTGGLVGASSGSGDVFGLEAFPQQLIVPDGYSGSSLSGSSTFDNVTIASLGLTPGRYVYTWGSGADADSLTVNVAAVPEPSTWAMMLLGFAGLGFAGYRKSRRPAASAA
jgi:PEP-CTERM motif-containing protein